MDQTKVSTKYQVVIPKKIREKVKLKPGQVVRFYTTPGTIHLELPDDKKWPDDYIGSEKDIWGKIDIEKYLAEEDASWDF